MLTKLRVARVLASQFPLPLRSVLGGLALCALVSAIGCGTGQPAADFALTTFARDEFRLSEQRGNVVVINTEVEARQFVEELGLTFAFATDVRARVAQEYAVVYFPTTYFIDQGGRVHLMEISRMDIERLTEILDDMLG